MYYLLSQNQTVLDYQVSACLSRKYRVLRWLPFLFCQPRSCQGHFQSMPCKIFHHARELFFSLLDFASLAAYFLNDSFCVADEAGRKYRQGSSLTLSLTLARLSSPIKLTMLCRPSRIPLRISFTLPRYSMSFSCPSTFLIFSAEPAIESLACGEVSPRYFLILPLAGSLIISPGDSSVPAKNSPSITEDAPMHSALAISPVFLMLPPAMRGT